MDLAFRPEREPVSMSTEVVCAAVGLDRTYFKFIHSKGQYRLLERDIGRGNRRLWRDRDLLNIFVFARLTELGVRAAEACQITEDFDAALDMECNKHARRLILVKGYNRTAIFWPDRYKDQATDKLVPAFNPDDQILRMFTSPLGPHNNDQGIGPVMYTLDFYLPNIREIVNANVNRELQRLKDKKTNPQ